MTNGRLVVEGASRRDRADVSGGIRAISLSKRFGTLVALDGVDARVAAGEATALMGPNGSGKSTLLRILATTLIADSGTATIAGHDVRTAAREARRSVGCVLGDDRSWYWRLTGRENLEFFAALHGLSREQASARISAQIEEHQLSAPDRPVSDYSTGMRLRLALARALIADPAVLLLDEPTRSLDPAATAGLRKKVTELTRERGVAVLFATHDLGDARAAADRVLVLQAGKVVAPTGADGLDELMARKHWE